MIKNDGFYHSDHSRQYKNEMGRKFNITGTLETRYTQMLFAFFSQSNCFAIGLEVSRRGESCST